MSNLFKGKYNIFRNLSSTSNVEANVNDEGTTSHTWNNSKENVELRCLYEIERLSKSGFEDLENVIEYLDSSTIQDITSNSSKILLANLQLVDIFPELNTTELEILTEKFINKSIVIYLASQNGSKFRIYWKSKDIRYFLCIKHFDTDFKVEDSIIYDFTAEFLAISLTRDDLGVQKNWPFEQNTMKIELFALCDPRGFNLLHLASESGKTEIVELLLSLGFETETPIKGINAQTLALKNHHSDVLLAMAHANLLYPKGMNLTEQTESFKAFYKPVNDLHKAIIEKNIESVKEIMKQRNGSQFFLNLANESAAKVALDEKAFEIYEIFLMNEVFLAPHEYDQEVLENLTYEEQKIIRELHNKHSKDLPDKHINILMMNSHVAHDVPDVQEKLQFINEAYKFLSQNPNLNMILKAVAASKKFKLIFDFNRNAVNIADPTTSDNTAGVFYPMGRIYIGAKQMLDPQTKLETYATIIHELTHFATNLAFRNKARPYLSNDNETLQAFERISEKCRKKCENEEVVNLVYELYEEDMHHAELIVRIPHMLALYNDDLEKLNGMRRNFPELNKFFENIFIPEIEKAIPEIERQEDIENEKKNKKISKLKRNLIWLIIFAVIGIVVAGCVAALAFSEPLYKFSELPEAKKLQVGNGIVIYKNVDIKFQDLFNRNSSAYNELTSKHISQILDGKPLNFSDRHFLYLDQLVRLKWTDLAENLRHKFLKSNFTFQNESIKFEKLHDKYPNVFTNLTSSEIIDILDGKTLIVGSMISNNTEFFVERKFTSEKKYKMSKQFINQTFNMDSLIDSIMRIRLLALSAEAGAGKSVIFRQFAIKIKRRFPMRWVSYVELKDNTKFYKASTNTSISIIHEMMAKICNISTDFELGLFKELYNAGEVVLLWNGYDEITPQYNEFILDAFKLIFTNSSNVQLVSTRPLYSNHFEQAFNIIPYQLVPFNENEQEEFLRKFLIFQKINESEIDFLTKKIRSISAKFGFYTPLMLIMIGEIHNEGDYFESGDLYKIYQIFIEKKVSIWQEKSEFFKNVTRSILSGTLKFNIIECYQIFAMRTIMNEFAKLPKLNIVRKVVPIEFPIEEISRMGILFIESATDHEFAHRTFAEFFVAQYFIESLYIAKNDLSETEATLRIEAFCFLINKVCSTAETTINFIKIYIDSEDSNNRIGFNKVITRIWKTKFRNLLTSNLECPHLYDEFLLKFFKKDHGLLLDMLHVNDNSTVYTESFVPLNVPISMNPFKYKNYVANYLSDKELDRFITGHNQKGNILIGSSFLYLLNETKFHHPYVVDIKMLNKIGFYQYVDQIISNLTVNEQKEAYKLFLNPLFHLSEHYFVTFSHYPKYWSASAELLSKQELLTTIGDIITYYIKNLIKWNWSSRQQFLPFILDKCKENFTDDEIVIMFHNSRILQASADFFVVFESLWEFYANHSNVASQRAILQLEDPFDTCDKTPVNILQRMFTYSNFEDFVDYIINIYKLLFNESEMQELILKSNDFLIYTVLNAHAEDLKELGYYLEKLFEEKESLLMEFIMRKIDLTEMSVFNYIDFFSTAHSKTIQNVFKIYWKFKSKVENVEFDINSVPLYVDFTESDIY